MPLKRNKGSVATTTQYDFETEISDAIDRSKAAVALLIQTIVEAGDSVHLR